MTTETTKRPRKDEISSVIKLLKLEASKNRNFAKGNRDDGLKRPHFPQLLKFADKQDKTADTYERVASWIASL